VASVRRVVRVVSGTRKAAMPRSPTVIAAARSWTTRTSGRPHRTTGPGSPIGRGVAASVTSAPTTVMTRPARTARAAGRAQSSGGCRVGTDLVAPAARGAVIGPA
jgi:hypothetical protein